MVDIEEPKEKEKQPNPDVIENVHNVESDLFSPRFKSVAAMAGWDEESILVASLIVEDTPDRDLNQRKRSDSRFKSPSSTNSRRKRRIRRRSPIPVAVLNLEDEETIRQASDEKKEQSTVVADTNEANKRIEIEPNKEDSGVSCSSSVLPCMDKLREELSCAICLEICFEPSTTSCGHSFCKKCLRSAADKCGKKCPKCRQLISNGRSCTVNTVLWNTIQLLFPQEVEARKAASPAAASHSPKNRISVDVRHQNSRPSVATRRRSTMEQEEDSTSSTHGSRNDSHARLLIRHTNSSSQIDDVARPVRREANDRRRRGGTPSQDEDTALALRLQREEFMEAYRGSHNDQTAGRSVSLARANLRAMASRALNARIRSRHVQ